ncbi:MAG: heparinase II/III family protein [Ginsengibacter sp.]
MRRICQLLFLAFYYTISFANENSVDHLHEQKNKNTGDTLSNAVVEPWSYTENFEDRELGAWASYPHWQDIAYDQNFRVNEMVSGDTNISIVQKVTPYSNVDNYAGAQKLLDMYLVPGSTVSCRYYLKTNQFAEFCKIRFAAGKYGKIDVTIPHPETNKWVWITVSFDDFMRENPVIAGNDKVRIYALAFLAKIPTADPAMPIYLGLDDITFKGARATPFAFAEPAMYKLPEFEPYIPKNHYARGDMFKLAGRWTLAAKKVTLEITSYTDVTKAVYKGTLTKHGDSWELPALKLSFPDGLYLGKLIAYGDSELSSTEFTIHIAPVNIAGKHPRLLFDAGKKKWIEERFKEERFKKVYDDILKNAKIQREQIPVDGLVFDLDQFPDEDWLPTWEAWGSHILNTAGALRLNSMAYAFGGDHQAGEYVKKLLVTLAGWPNWTHPWQTKRGRFAEHRTGDWSHRLAEAYDLTYDLMTPDERTKIRKAIMKNIVEGVHRTYVYDDNVTGKTSNWIAMTVGGSLMNMAAVFGDGPETENIEPYFTGAMMKFYTFINRVTDKKDGAWGEGLGYNDYSFSNMSYSVPSLKNVFNIDVSKPLAGTYNEYIWAGLVKGRQFFHFGDNNQQLMPITNWAFLLHMQHEPRLGWFYNYLKEGESFEDVLYDTKNVEQESPFGENPDKVFHEIGTTVFKSGWNKDDFSFVMRTGAFYNHQHMDQGSFWLADHGVNFIGERKGSSYYDDPLYQPWFIQPVAHSTILVNGNHQSQRVGDELRFAPGFDDHAFIAESLDGKDAAFSSGDIGRLYWGQVKSLSRNVLFLKPRTLLMLDVVEPGNKDAGISLLYQTAHLGDISAGKHLSTITKEGFSLNIMHLAPNQVDAKAVETPHYLNTLLKEKPLIKEGMLMVTAPAKGNPLVMANLLSTTIAGVAPAVKVETGDGFITGVATGKKFVFITKPGSPYHIENMETDALAMTWSDDRIFVAEATILRKNGVLILGSETPVTFEISADSLKYSCNKGGKLSVGAEAKPTMVMLNGSPSTSFIYDSKNKIIIIEVNEGEGSIVVK